MRAGGVLATLFAPTLRPRSLFAPSLFTLFVEVCRFSGISGGVFGVTSTAAGGKKFGAGMSVPAAGEGIDIRPIPGGGVIVNLGFAPEAFATGTLEPEAAEASGVRNFGDGDRVEAYSEPVSLAEPSLAAGAGLAEID